MAFRAGNTTYVPGRGNVSPKKRKGRRKTEVKGPYRSQSSNPKIRSEARPSEHRKVVARSAPRKGRRKPLPAPRVKPSAPPPSLESHYLRDPRRAALAARFSGTATPAREKIRWTPKAKRAVAKARWDYIGEHEGLKDDPVGEAVLSAAAGGGLGLGAKALGTAAAKGAGSLLARGGAEATATKGIAARTASRTAAAKAQPRTGGRLLGKEELKARPTPRAKRNLAAHESNVAAKRAARRIRPKARARAKVKVGRGWRKMGVRYGKEGRKVARRTREVKLGANAPYIASTGAGVGALGVLEADIGGHVNEFKSHPAAVAKRTLEIAPGLVISTADLAAQAAVAVGTGDTKGLRKRISEDFRFAKELYLTMISGDEARVREFVGKNGFVAPLILAPSVVRAGAVVKRGTTVHPTRPRETDLSEMNPPKRKATRQKWRKRLSRDAAMARARATAKTAAAGGPVVRAYQGRRGRKGVENRRQLREQQVDPGDVVALAAEEGLRPGRQAAANFEAVARKWGARPVFTDKRKGGVTGHDLIAYVRDRAGIWEDKAFWRTVEAYRAQEPARRTSERIVDIEQAKTHGVQLAENRPTPTGRALIPGVKSREEVATFISKSGEGGKRVRRLRETIRTAEGRARQVRAELKQLETGRVDKSRKQTVALLNRRRQQLLDIEADVRGMRAELAGTVKRHKAIARSLRDPAEAAALKQEFDAELAAVREDRGLARGAWVPHTDVGVEGIPVVQPVTRAAKKVYKRKVDEASLAERGRVDYSLSTVLQAGIEAPIIRQELHAFVDRAVREGAIPFRDPRTGQLKRIGTSEQLERSLTPEQKAKGFKFPLSHFKQAIRDDDMAALEGIVDNLGSEVAAVEGKPGHKYAFLDHDYGLELKAQLTAPGSGLRKAQALSRGLSRTILTSPAWAEGQVLAEGFQALHSINPLNPFNIYHFYQGYVRGLRGMDPAKRLEFRAETGAMPGMGQGPREFATVSGQTHRGLASNFRKMERVLPLKRLIQAVRGDWIKAVDRAKGGEFRVMVAATKAHKDAMGFGKRLERLVTNQRELSEKLAAMSQAQRLEWMTRDSASKRRNTDYTDDAMGNWTAFSRKENVFAPAAIFYNFLRMSMQWPFYTYPKHHPVRASVMYALAGSHNNQLRELLGGPPSWFGEYATAIVYGEQFKGGALTIKGTRIIPGAGPVFEGLAAGLDVAAQRALNPIASYFNALFNGIDPLSGEKVDPEHLSAEERFIARGGLTLSLLFNTFPPARAAEQLKGPKEKTALPLVGERYEKSALGDLLEELNGSPEEKAVQTLFNPIPMTDLDKAQDRAAMGRIFTIWRRYGSDAQNAVKKDKGLTVRQKEKRIKAMEKRSDEAFSEEHRLFRKYDIAYKAEEKKALAEWSRLTYGKKESSGTGWRSSESSTDKGWRASESSSGRSWRDSEG